MKKIILILTIALTAFCSHAQTYSLNVQDTRSTVTSPGTYSYSLTPYFKSATALSLPSVGNGFYTTIGFRGWGSDNTGDKAHELAFSDDSRIFFRSGNSPTWEGWRQLVVADENGNVGINTANTAGYKFAVNGSAIATSMKVKLNGSWPDFVFLKDYKLPTLTEVKTYIDQNQHLPDMPSADEVHANGLDLGEMNRLLLKKVEELTLYLIQKEEHLNKQRDELYKQKQVNQSQQYRIALIQKQLNSITKTLTSNKP